MAVVDGEEAPPRCFDDVTVGSSVMGSNGQRHMAGDCGNDSTNGNGNLMVITQLILWSLVNLF